MGRIFKVVGLVLAALVLLVVAAMIAATLLFDPNDYKDRITEAVADATGRTLTLEGDLELNLFPRISIGLGAAQFSDAEGFGTEPFASFDSAELRVGLLPLLSRRIEIDRAVLSGLRLRLARNAAGTTNWDDLGGQPGAPASAEPDAAPSGSSADLDISVDSIEIRDAEVSWRDEAANQDWVLSSFNLAARDFDPGRPFPLSIAFSLTGAEVSVSVESEMRASVALAQNQYRLDALTVDLEGEGPGWPGGSGEAHLEFDSLAANLETQSVTLDGLMLEMLGMTVHGNLAGEDVMDSLSLVGDIEIDEFDPREMMAVFDTAIETADPDVLRSASARAEFYFDSNRMGMREMALALDDSVLNGSAGVVGERFEFDLSVNAINIDRYLPPPAEGEETEADTGSVDEVDLPIDPLRNFNARGNLALGETQFLGMTFTDANFALAAANGRMTLTPTGRLYGGTIDGEIGIAVQGDAARLTLRQTLAGVDMAGIARDYLKIDALEGTGSVNLDLAAVGAKVGEIKQDLDGTASLAITDGAWLGVDIWHQVKRLRATISGPDVPELEGPARTTFDRIAVGGPVENAVMTTSEFAATLPFAALTGEGTIHLLTTALDIRARAGLVDGPTLQEDPVLAAYAGRQLPLTISGTLDAPRVLPDVRALLSQAVQQRVEEEVDEAVDEAREEIREEAEERLRDRLRDIF